MATNNVNFKVKNGLDAGDDISTTGIFKSNASAGDEGGQIDLAKAATNTTLTTGVTLDVYQNKLRIFETGGTNRGYYLDISAGGTSVGSNLSGGSGTVTSVSMTVPTGLSISGSPVTGSGTLALTLTSGYSIPTTASQTNWDTAYGWGNHASAGYLTTSSASSTYEPKITAGTTAQYWRGDKSWQTLNSTSVGLGSVENTALSTWAGSTNITTLGTIGTGTWNATAIADGKIASALTGKTYNGLTITTSTGTLTVTNAKTLSISNTLTLSGTDSTTMTFPTTSATIARTDSAQTFTGIQTMTSPSITTSLTTGSTSFDLLNTTATTINLGGAATTFNVGYSGTAASTTNISTGATTTATTKTINIGTGGASASTTNINLGGGTTSQTSNINVLGMLKLDGAGVRATPVAGAMEYDTIAPYFTASTTYGRGVMPSMSLFKLGTTRSITDGTSNSSLFGKSLTVEGGRSYYFKIVVGGTKGTTSSFVRFLFDGTATFQNVYYYGAGTNGVAPDTISGRTVAGSAQANISLASTGTIWSYMIEGTFSVASGSGGTWIPSCNFSATTGSTPTVVAGSYMYIYPISSTISGDISIGAWA